LMPDRFANGDPSNDSHSGMLEKANRANLNGRHGGDIKGISNHLNYISDLGFTTLWINPLVENNNPEYSYHGYAITDFYKIDPRYGTNEDYVNLVSQAHNKNLKVVMDMVFNHCSIYHWFIEDLPFENWIHQFDEFTRSNFRASTIVDPHASDGDRDKMLTGWFDQHMADLDQRNGFLSDYLIQNTIWWIEYAGIDGIRVDTQPYSYKEFISDWAKAVFEEYPDFSIVGEAWLQEEAFTAYFQADADNPDGYNSHIPSVTDFPMRNVLNEAFNESNSWTGGLAKIYYVLAQDNIYPDAGNNLIFLDNHDLDRYYTSVKLDFRKWKMGVGALLTLRGIPSVYYGTELLMTGKEHDGHGHIRMDFPGGWVSDTRNAFEKAGRTEAEQKAYTYMKKLLNWRKTNEAVIKGTTKQFVPDGDTYVYFRCYPGKNVMVAMNNNENEMKALQTERFAECLEGYTWAENVITGEKVHYLDAITVAPKSILILELKK
ncbi:MAG: cyclomaltodextrinase C-terminal domain-containing protein, partial [Bacteroidales bacterium]|nr:cyclomaltodextrinase C-terminal domain-containing protein [Bacteroidales bacterium]